MTKTKDNYTLLIRTKNEWKRVKEANLGSLKKPNKKILEFEFNPVQEQEVPEFKGWFIDFK